MATSNLQALWNHPTVSGTFECRNLTRGKFSANFSNASKPLPSCWTLVRAEATTSTSSAITQARVAVGEEPVRGSALHSVTVVDRQRGVTHKFEVPEDQYILHTGEDQDIDLPFSCRHGCCTACAVRVKSGQLYQPEALGISAELKEQGYGLLCVGYALSDLEVETQDEDEVYWLQFGRYFARGPVERDDFALELAMADE
ncbi:ferredoxin [Marchantia polymorpha subsp. ruderalis]